MSAVARTIEEPYDGTLELPYGWIKWLRICGLCLIFYIAFLGCLAVYMGWDNNNNRFRRNELDNEITVSDSTFSEITVTATPDYK